MFFDCPINLYQETPSLGVRVPKEQPPRSLRTTEPVRNPGSVPTSKQNMNKWFWYLIPGFSSRRTATLGYRATCSKVVVYDDSTYQQREANVSVGAPGERYLGFKDLKKEKNAELHLFPPASMLSGAVNHQSGRVLRPASPGPLRATVQLTNISHLISPPCAALII